MLILAPIKKWLLARLHLNNEPGGSHSRPFPTRLPATRTSQAELLFLCPRQALSSTKGKFLLSCVPTSARPLWPCHCPWYWPLGRSTVPTGSSPATWPHPCEQTCVHLPTTSATVTPLLLKDSTRMITCRTNLIISYVLRP